jgi:hypothetical protein
VTMPVLGDWYTAAHVQRLCRSLQPEVLLPGGSGGAPTTEIPRETQTFVCQPATVIGGSGRRHLDILLVFEEGSLVALRDILVFRIGRLRRQQAECAYLVEPSHKNLRPG